MAAVRLAMTMVAAAACGASESASPGASPTVSTVVVTHAQGSAIRVGTPVPMTVVAKSAQGQILTGRPVMWSSRVPSVATVDASGVALALSPGSTTIDATVDGVTGSTMLSVIAVPVASVEVTPSAVTMLPHTTQLFRAVARDASGTVVTGRSVSWSSGDVYTLSVNTAGLITALGPGMTSVIATVDGVQGIAPVTILPRTLVLGQTVRSMTGAVGVPQYTIRVPEGTRGLLVRTTDGVGELALTLYQGESTAADHLVCTSASASTRQLCAVAWPVPGIYTLRTSRYSVSGFTDVTLDVNPVLPRLTLGETVTGLASDGDLLYQLTVPAGTASLTVRTIGGTGTLTLTVFEGDVPASGWSRCASAMLGTAQQCTISAPVTGVYTVRLAPAMTMPFSGVSVQVTTP